MAQGKLKLLYDGTCLVCHKEISYYMKHDKNNILEPIDISEKDFDAEKYNLTKKEVNKFFHVIDNNKVYSGVEAFIRIWERLEGFQRWARIGRHFLIQPCLKLGYFFFIHIRPFLPKRKDCSI